MTDYISRADAIDAVVSWTVEDRPHEVMPTDLVDRIKALPSAELTLQTPQTYGKSINPSNAEVVEDLISRADAIDAVMKYKMPFSIQQEVAREIDALPSADAVDCTDFIEWLVDRVLDETIWENNSVAYGEIICRKLVKLGVLEATEEPSYYIRPSAEKPHGEWTYLSGSKGSYMTISCPICGSTFDNVAEWKYNYCPNCGARMKGGDDE